MSCAAIAVYLQLGARDAGRVRAANDQAAAGRFAQAVSTARSVDSTPADLRAMHVEARTLALAGRPAAASRVYARIARRDPNNWLIQYEWARVSFRTEPVAAIARMRRAKELNPLLPVDTTPRAG